VAQFEKCFDTIDEKLAKLNEAMFVEGSGQDDEELGPTGLANISENAP
jgi:hypothetical protein